MRYNTACEKCIFSAKVESDKPCEFNIIDEIILSKSHALEEQNSFYYIKNYNCKYGFSKEKLKDFQNISNDIDIRDYVIEKNYIDYFMVVDNTEDNLSTEEITDLLYQLAIKPKSISVLTKLKDTQNAVTILKEKIPNGVIWKLHNFYYEQLDKYMCLYSALSTNKLINKSPYIWIISAASLKHAIDGKHIDQINYIINIRQPELGILKKTSSDYYNGLFLTTKNYLMLTQNLDQNINSAIEKFTQIHNTSINTYD